MTKPVFNRQVTLGNIIQMIVIASVVFGAFSTVDKRTTVHATEIANVRSVHESDNHNQREALQRIEGKLDRLIERNDQ